MNLITLFLHNRSSYVPVPVRSNCRGFSDQRGASLIELMVAMVIGLFLVGAVVALYVNTSSGARGSTIESQLNEDASLAMELLQQQIRQAGFSDTDADGNRLFSGLAVRGCDTSFAANDAAFSGLTCGSGSSDALAVRFHATTLNTQPSGTNPTNCAYESITAWTPGATEGASTSLTLADNRYYIANDSSNDNTPSLFCQGRTGTGFGTATALIPGVEEMQLTYGVTAQPIADEPLPHQITAYLSATGVASLAGNWSRVAAVRICLVARSTKKMPTGTSGLGTYRNCADTQTTNTDGYLRRAYVSTIFLRNMRPASPAAYELDGSTAANPWAYMKDE